MKLLFCKICGDLLGMKEWMKRCNCSNVCNTDLEKRYSEMVKLLLKDGCEIMGHTAPIDMEMLHMLILLSEETGELLSAFKKNIFYQKEIDMDNVIEELGDIEFALEAIRGLCGISRDLVLKANIGKLVSDENARYGEDGYSDEAAQERKDKK